MTDTPPIWNPADFTRDEVLAYVDVHPDQAAAVLAAERARGDKARPTVVDGIERRIAAAASAPTGAASSTSPAPTATTPTGEPVTGTPAALTQPVGDPTIPPAPTSASAPADGTQTPTAPAGGDPLAPLTGDGGLRPPADLVDPGIVGSDLDLIDEDDVDERDGEGGPRDEVEHVRLGEGEEATTIPPPEADEGYYSNTVGREQPTT